MLSYDWLGLLAATCWAAGSLLSVAPSRHLGAFAFTRWRMVIVSSGLWLVVFLTSTWQELSVAQAAMLALSGLIGIVVGDTANFSAMNRIGPRRAGVLFATNAIFTAVAGYLLLNETFGLKVLAGACLTLTGVFIAILFGKREQNAHAWESDHGRPLVGISLALLAALCQTGAMLIAKPIMAAGANPVTASAVRTSSAAIVHLLLFCTGASYVQNAHALNLRALLQTGLSGAVGMGFGMTFLLLALRFGNVGTVAVLSSVTPVLLLFLLWVVYRATPPLGAWLGAILTFAGTALILLR
jgi:drug/metabolite transporter (DMT)-like permease